MAKKLHKFFLKRLPEHDREVSIHINSPGGDLLAGIAMYEHIRIFRAMGFRVTAWVEGMAYSAATLPLMSSNHRIITKHSTLMIHQVSTAVAGTYLELKDDYKGTKRYMKTLKRMYRRLKITEVKLNKLIKRDKILKAKVALRYGFVDEVL